MPLLLHCADMKVGMRLHESINSGGRTLLVGGKVLSHADVDVLRRFYPNIWVRIVDPILEEIVEFEDDSHDREVAASVQSRVASAMVDVGERFSARASVKSLDMHAIQDSVVGILEYLNDNPVSAALLTRTLDAGNPMDQHVGNVLYLSMILGSAIRDYVSAARRKNTAIRWLDIRMNMDLVPLGMGAMFMDLGMFPLQYLYGVQRPLTDAERQSIREHPEVGADMLPVNFMPTASEVVRDHHENYDGSGYPAGKSGSNIHVFSRIVRIADAYDAATASNVYREAKSPARVLWEMSVGSHARFYDPILIKVFTTLIQPFPIGAKLHLSDGRFAVVVRYNHQNPFKPVVLIAFDSNDERLPDSQIEGPLSLAARPELCIRSFAGEQLSYLYREPIMDKPGTAQSEIATLFESVYP